MHIGCFGLDCLGISIYSSIFSRLTCSFDYRRRSTSALRFFIIYTLSTEYHTSPFFEKLFVIIGVF
jgi:hypothetical protein